MNNFTLLETILIIYLLAIYVLSFIMIIMAYYASEKASDIIFYIWFVVGLPITLPIVLLKLRQRKQDLEKEFDDIIKEEVK